MFKKITYIGAFITLSITLSLFVTAIDRLSSHPSSSASAAKIFCQGWHPKLSQYYLIRYSKENTARAHLELLTKNSPQEEWHLKLTDPHGILGETPPSSTNSTLERIAMQGENPQNRLQFYRSCSPVPVCSLEEIMLPHKDTVDLDQRKYYEMSRQALEARKATSMHMNQQTEIANKMTQAQVEVIAALAKEQLVHGKPLQKEWTAENQNTLVRAATDYVAKSFALSKKRAHQEMENTASLLSIEKEVLKAYEHYRSLLPQGSKAPTSYENLNLSIAKNYELEIRHRAHELTQRFHNLSAAASELERQSQIFRETSSLAPVNPTITSLEPLEPEVWCRRP